MSTNIRIITALATQDIADAIKNKSTWSTILVVTFFMIFYRVSPSLRHGDRPLELALYDAGNSGLTARLENSDQLDLTLFPSQEELETYLGTELTVILGLALPADFDQSLERAERLELNGYVVHWASASAKNEARTFFEAQLAQLTGKPVRINTIGHTVYTQPDGGPPFMTSLLLILTLALVGLSVTPTLMLEEQQTRTLDALLVSPASAAHIVAGKAIAGLSYCLLAAGIVLAFEAALVLNWGLALLTVVCGALFVVALGLLLGTVFETQQQAKIWSFLAMQFLLIPLFLTYLTDVLPSTLASILYWLPTAALMKAMRISLSTGLPLSQGGLALALVAVYAALLLAAVSWLTRRSNM